MLYDVIVHALTLLFVTAVAAPFIALIFRPKPPIRRDPRTNRITLGTRDVTNTRIKEFQ